MWHRVGLELAVDWGIADSREPTLWVHFESEVPSLCQFQEPSLYTIKAVFILDNDGRRLLAKVTPLTTETLKTVPGATCPRQAVPTQPV